MRDPRSSTIESDLGHSRARYDARARIYDAAVRSRWLNRIVLAADPADYVAFAARAINDGTGPLLEVPAGTVAATGSLHAASGRQTLLADRSLGMLEQAAARLSGPSGVLPAHIQLRQIDVFSFVAPHPFSTIMSLGFLHLLDDPRRLLDALQQHLADGGTIYLSSLVAETRVGRWYLRLLHLLGEVAPPRTARELGEALGGIEFETTGCMAYAVISKRSETPTTSSTNN